MNIKKMLQQAAPQRHLDLLTGISLSANQSALQIYLSAGQPLPPSWLKEITLSIVPADKGSPIEISPEWTKDQCTLAGGSSRLDDISRSRLGITGARQLEVRFESITVKHSSGLTRTLMPPRPAQNIPQSVSSNPYIEIIIKDALGNK